jgi:hypothetical protein
MSDALDTFGRLVMENLRDKAFDDADLTLRGHWKAPRLRALQKELAALTDEQRDVARRLVRHVVDSAIHDFLFALQERADFDPSVRIVVHGTDITTASDGLHGEAFGENGWQARFSRYGKAAEEA